MAKDALNKKQTQKVVKMYKDNVSENDILVHIVTEGIAFGQAKKIYKTVLEENGLIVADSKIEELMKETIEIEEVNTFADFQAKVDEVESKVEGAKDGQVMRLVKKAFRTANVDIPKKTNVAVKTRIENYILEHPDCKNKHLKKFIVEDLGKSEAMYNKWQATLDFAKQFVDATTEEVEA